MNPNKTLPMLVQIFALCLFSTIAAVAVGERAYELAVVAGLWGILYAVALGIAVGRESKR